MDCLLGTLDPVKLIILNLYHTTQYGVAHTSEILALGRWKQEDQCAVVSSGNKTSQFGGKLLKIQNVKADVKQQGYVLFVFCCCFWFFETSYLYVALASWKQVMQSRLASNQRSARLCTSSAGIKGLQTLNHHTHQDVLKQDVKREVKQENVLRGAETLHSAGKLAKLRK